MSDVTIMLTLSDSQAADFAQLVKRLARRSLGRDDLNLVTAEEATNAEAAVLKLVQAIGDAGFSPR